MVKDNRMISRQQEEQKIKKGTRKSLNPVGVIRLELTTPCTPCKYASQLRHTPKEVQIYKIYQLNKAQMIIQSLGTISRLSRIVTGELIVTIDMRLPGVYIPPSISPSILVPVEDPAISR